MQKSLRSLQIITAALVAGVVMFAVVSFVIPLDISESMPEFESIAGFALPMLALSCGFGYFVLRKQLTQRMKLRIDEEGFDASTLPPEFMSLTIVGAAMAEGVALFGVVTHWITGQPVFLIATVVAVAVMLLQIPTEAKVLRFFENLRS
jgi:protein-S-isoprenylcysteine O-methyltransferase Ste14